MKTSRRPSELRSLEGVSHEPPHWNPAPETSARSDNFVIRLSGYVETAILRLMVLGVAWIRKAVPGRIRAVHSGLESLSHSLAAKNTLLLLIYNGLGGAASIATQLLIINGLGKERFGEYAFFLALGAYGRAIVRYGRDKTMVRDIVQSPPECFGRIVGTTFQLSLALGCLYLLGLGIFGRAAGIDLSHNLWLVVIGAMLPSFDLQPVYDSWREMGKHGSYSLFRNLLSAFIIWTIYYFFPAWFTIEAIASVILISLLFTQYLEYREVLLRSHIRLFTRSNVLGIFKQFYDNFSLGFASLLFIFMGPTIQIILARYHGRTEVGLYASGLQIFVIINFLYDQILRVASPTLALVAKPGYTRRARRRAVFKSLLVMAVPAFASTIPMIFFPRITVAIMFKPEFAAVADLLPVLGIYQFLFGFGMVFARYIQTSRYDVLYLLSVSSGVVSSLILGFLIIPRYGLHGAAWTLLISHGLSMALYGGITAYDLFFRPETSDARR